jgi:hypothetical protein
MITGFSLEISSVGISKHSWIFGVGFYIVVIFTVGERFLWLKRFLQKMFSVNSSLYLHLQI